MAYFRSFFGGGPAEQEDDSGTEIVERFVERVETGTSLEDRRDALRALRNMAKKMRLAIGTMGIGAFLDILTKERNTTDLVALTLEILVSVLNGDDDVPEDDELGERLAEVMLKKATFIPAILAILEQYEFTVRRVSVQLLTSLLRHRGSEVQNAVIGQPMGVTKMVDLIHDNREVVRNEAVLMLCELSRAHSQVQQLLAYDNAFNLLLDIIETEPIDSIVIEDCLFVILNLLRKNANNQQLFRENNLIVRVGGILQSFLFPEDETSSVETEWAKQRTANLIFLMQIIRALVGPENSQANTHAAQKLMHQTHILGELCRVLLSESGVSVDVLTEAVIAVAEIIRGNYNNQEYFASCSLVTAEGGHRPALLVLLISMTAERQPFKLRCAVFYCFLSYLHDNEFGKTKIIETLLPSSQSVDSSLSTGSMVIQALSSSESVQSWFGSVALLHCLLEVEHLREQLLRVQLSLTVDEPPAPLLCHLAKMLVSLGNRRIQQRAGLLMLLCTWINRCPPAVEQFVADQENLTYLSTQIVDECGEGSESEQQVVRGLMATLLLLCLHYTQDEKTRNALDALVTRRVGREYLGECIDGVSRTEQFVRAAQKPQPLAKTPQELFLDYHFIKLFKANEATLLKIVRSSKEMTASPGNNEAIIQSFKDLIKRQDEEISVLKTEHKRAKEEVETMKVAQSSKVDMERELEETRRQLEQKCVVGGQMDQLNEQITHLTSVNQQWMAEVEKYKQWATQWQNYQLGQLPNGGEVAIQQLQQQQTELEQQLQYGWQAFEQQSTQIRQHMEAAEAWKTRAESLEKEITEMKREREQTVRENGHVADPRTEEELRKLKEEQEDLLVLLADQHNKISHYRKRFRGLGQQVSEDEDED